MEEGVNGASVVFWSIGAWALRRDVTPAILECLGNEAVELADSTSEAHGVITRRVEAATGAPGVQVVDARSALEARVDARMRLADQLESAFESDEGAYSRWAFLRQAIDVDLSHLDATDPRQR